MRLDYQLEAQTIAKKLIGTDREVRNVCDEEGIDYEYFGVFGGYDYLDELVFQCDDCDKWRSVDDIAEALPGGIVVCKECYYKHK